MSTVNRRKNVLLGILSTAALATTLVVADPAQQTAEASVFNCPNGDSCDWFDANFSGTRWGGSVSVPVYSSSRDNRTSSITNRSARGARWFQGTNYSGVVSLYLAPGGLEQSLAFIYNDVFSSKAN